jgi:hypothetical protein
MEGAGNVRRCPTFAWYGEIPDRVWDFATGKYVATNDVAVSREGAESTTDGVCIWCPLDWPDAVWPMSEHNSGSQDATSTGMVLTRSEARKRQSLPSW